MSWVVTKPPNNAINTDSLVRGSFVALLWAAGYGGR